MDGEWKKKRIRKIKNLRENHRRSLSQFINYKIN